MPNAVKKTGVSVALGLGGLHIFNVELNTMLSGNVTKESIIFMAGSIAAIGISSLLYEEALENVLDRYYLYSDAKREKREKDNQILRLVKD